jgi:hypothetical protein
MSFELLLGHHREQISEAIVFVLIHRAHRSGDRLNIESAFGIFSPLSVIRAYALDAGSVRIAAQRKTHSGKKYAGTNNVSHQRLFGDGATHRNTNNRSGFLHHAVTLQLVI